MSSILESRKFHISDYKYDIINEKFGEGSFNNIKLIKFTENNQCAILRSPIKQQIGVIEQETHSALSFYHSKLFSEIVKQNVWPHFPILIHHYNYMNIYSTIIEHAELNSLLQICKNENTTLNDIKKLLLQIFLTIYYMNTILKISHNDLTIANILVKKLDSPQWIIYKITDDDKDDICIYTDKIVLISDFDLTRGCDIGYNRDYIINHYIDAASDAHQDDAYMQSVYRRLLVHIISENKETYKFDMAILLVSLSYYFKDFSRDIINDLFFGENETLFTIIKKYFNQPDMYVNSVTQNSVTQNSVTQDQYDKDNLFYVNQDLFSYNNMKYKNNKTLFNMLMHHTEVRKYFLNRYIISDFNLHRFDYKDTDCVDEYLKECPIPSLESQRVSLLQLLVQLEYKMAKLYEINVDKENLIRVFKLLDFVSTRYSNQNHYKLHGFICYYILNNHISIKQLIHVTGNIYTISQIVNGVQIINSICFEN